MSLSRRTPCVDGCCGPMLSTMSAVSSPAPVPTVISRRSLTTASYAGPRLSEATRTLSRMQRIEIDGVPVLWEQGPAPLRATLTFGVGGRDETFRTLGVTHMVEHLAMGA